MKKIVNTTATADVGYVEKLPFRRPGAAAQAATNALVTEIIAVLKRDPAADISGLRAQVDENIFDLFSIGPSRALVARFAEEVGRTPAQALSE